MTQVDLGLADAFINGDFSFVNKETGLLNLIMVLLHTHIEACRSMFKNF